MKKVFITGISGLLGTNLAIRLLEENYQVVGLVRNLASYKADTHKNLRLIEGGLFSDITPYLSEIDYVVHIAAETDQGYCDYLHYRKINADATVQLFQAAVKCGVKRFIFISTANTIGYGTAEKPGNEELPISYLNIRSYYAQSKAEAENYLVQQDEATEVIILNPGFLLGAHNNKPSSGKLILMAMNKKIVFCAPGGKNFVNVKDVVQAIILSFDKGKAGNRYYIGSENITFKDFHHILFGITGQRTLLIQVPRSVLLLAGKCGDMLRKLKINTAVNSANMLMLSMQQHYSNKKSVEELGMTYTPIDDGIKEAVEYFLKRRQ